MLRRRQRARPAGGALSRAEVDLAFLFLSPAHLDEAEAAAEAVWEELAPRHLLGCVAGGVVACVRELEDSPAVAVWAGALPGASAVRGCVLPAGHAARSITPALASRISSLRRARRP